MLGSPDSTLATNGASPVAEHAALSAPSVTGFLLSLLALLLIAPPWSVPPRSGGAGHPI